MSSYENIFIGTGKPHFGNLTKRSRDVAKELEAVLTKRRLSFSKTKLFPPSAFPEYGHPHFEYYIFKGPSTSSEYDAIVFDYLPKLRLFHAYAEMPDPPASPLVKFIAEKCLGVNMREDKRNRYTPQIKYQCTIPAAREFDSNCWSLAKQIREIRKIGDGNIKNQTLIKSRLNKLCQFQETTGSKQMFNRWDYEDMTRYARELYVALRTWISLHHPEQLDNDCRDHDSFAGAALDLFEGLHSEGEWIDALFPQEDGPHRHYNPKPFRKLYTAYLKMATKEIADKITDLNNTVIAQKAELKDHITAETDRAIAAKAPKRKRKYGHEGNGHRGPKTSAQAGQLKDFESYLHRHPDTNDPSFERRARDFLRISKGLKTNEATGDNHGYASYRYLAQAKRNKHRKSV